MLYMAFGLLHWRDTDGSEMSSPLFLVPVQLLPEGPLGTPRITEGDDDPVLNPALILRLKEFGIELPSIDDFEGKSVTAILAMIREALQESENFKSWNLHETTYLSTFSFAKESMFKDLLDNEERVLAHPVVRALATSDPSKQSASFQFDPISPDQIDRLAAPETTPLVLDADSSQRVAVAAALAGKTFVMDGPPGTGKSQTIANMIGALLHAGKTVLFVSEKMAALDVVRNRLDAAGLGSFLLELHSHKASRKEVATELLRTLDSVTQAPASMTTLSRQSVMKRRQQLNDYALAMNEIRVPLNMSLHVVLGMYSDLTTALIAPVPELGPAELTERGYLETQESLAQIVRAWRPAVQGTSFLWRQITDERSLEVRIHQAESALQQLHGTVELVADLASSFGLTKPSEVPRLSALIDHQHNKRPDHVRDFWLSAESTTALTGARHDLGQKISELKLAEKAVSDVARVSWTALPEPASVPHAPANVEGLATPLALQSSSAVDLSASADKFEKDARMLGKRLGSLSSVASSLGMARVKTFTEATYLGRLVDLKSLNRRPEREWFSTAGLAEARSAAEELRQHTIELSNAEDWASQTFTNAALQAPLADLQDRFENLHRGLRKLSRNYRLDKKTVAGLLKNAGEVKNGINHFSDAIAWDDASKAFNALSITRGEILGRHWLGRDTDFESLNAAINVVGEVLHLTDGRVPPALVNYMAGDDSNLAYQSVVDTARSDIDSWKRTLSNEPALAARQELLLEPIGDAVNWLAAHVEPMRLVAARIRTLEQVTQGEYTLTEVNRILSLVEAATTATDALRDEAPAFEALFGAAFDFGDTNLGSIDVAIDWAMVLREQCQGPLTAEQVELLTSSGPVDSLSTTFERWSSARDRIIHAFAPDRHNELLTELDNYSDAVALMSDLRNDTVGQQEWFEYQAAYSSLAERGLDTAVDFCVERRLVENDVPDVVNRALLRSWCDAVIQQDKRLRPLLAVDREALVEEFRALDRDVLTSATADIISSANTRRPTNTTMGESGVIRREGSKQKRHKPVRDLMATTRNVTPSIKGSSESRV